MSKIKERISRAEVDARIKELGKQISQDYADTGVHLVCILKGAFMFMSDLAKELTCPVTVDFMAVSSYEDQMESTGIVKIVKDLDGSIEGKHVLVVEDIIDSGRTLHYLMEILEKRNPKSLRLAAFLDKEPRRVVPVNVSYYGFKIEDFFVLGYGLDYKQMYRNLPFIGEMES
ncbi:hypoxanthine phosphoribosyltransferase [Clostridiales bacterium COT073_COT-073]|nr:hypoxanthine phosphoribosyltransferase [Clostridiales bacterium COT073_COT-073]